MNRYQRELTHGGPGGYRRGCRCEACVSAEALRMLDGDWKKAWRDARLAERVEIDGRLVHPAPGSGHGTSNAYISYGCRCEPCRTARSDYMRTQQKRRHQ